LHFLAQPAFRADAHAITDDQHPNHQLRIDRWPTCLTVVAPQMVADGTEIDKMVDGAEQAILGQMMSNPAHPEATTEALGYRLWHIQTLSVLLDRATQLRPADSIL
jgi:hypothetical protein